MKLLQKAACLAVACLLCAAPVRAESSYKATELAFPQGVAEGEKIQSFSVHGNRLDLFTTKQKTGRSGDTFTTRRFHSDDGGMTWKEMDVSWLNGLQGDSNWMPLSGVRADGSVYALLGKDGYVKLPTSSYNYFIGTLAVNKDGQTKTLCTLDDPDVCPYWPVGQSLSKEGDLALFAMGHSVAAEYGRDVVNRLITLDDATGAEKTNVAYGAPPELTEPKAYGEGTFFRVSKGNLEVTGADGKVKQTIRMPGSDSQSFNGNWGYGNGAFYELNAQGLFRFRPGETAWTKLLDSSVCKTGTAGSAETICEALYVDEDGSVTLLLRHFTLDSRYDEQTKAWTLTRYAPGA